MGIALSNSTDIAIESADIVLMRNDLLGVAAAIRLSRAVVRNIRQNLFWAFLDRSAPQAGIGLRPNNCIEDRKSVV